MISLRSIASADNGAGGTTLTITKPVGLAVDDLMFAVMGYDGGTGISITPPSGSWTLDDRTDDGTTQGLVTYWKAADAADVAASNFVWTLTSTTASGGIYAIVGADTISPIDTSSGNVGSADFFSWSDSLTTTTLRTFLIYSQVSESGTVDQRPIGMNAGFDELATALRTYSDYILYTPSGFIGNKAAQKSAATGYVANLTAIKSAGTVVPTISVKFGVFDISEGMISWNEGLSSDIEMIEMAKRHGLVVPQDPTVNARLIDITGSFNETTRNDLRRKLEQFGGYMFGQLGTASRVRDISYVALDIEPNLTPTIPNGGLDLSRNLLRFYDDRCISGYCTKLDHEFIEGTEMTVAAWSSKFMFPDPFWYDGTDNADGFISYLSYSKEGASGLTFDIVVDGNVPVFPVIRIGANVSGIQAPKASDLTLVRQDLSGADPNRSIIFDNSAATGYNKHDIVIYTRDFAIADAVGGTSDGKPYLLDGSIFFWLEPGSNRLTLTWTGGGDTVLEVTYRNRYY